MLLTIVILIKNIIKIGVFKMNVIYKVYLNEYEKDLEFPKLKRTFKREIVEQGMSNPHLHLYKWLKNNEVGITYSIGRVNY